MGIAGAAAEPAGLSELCCGHATRGTPSGRLTFGDTLSDLGKKVYEGCVRLLGLRFDAPLRRTLLTQVQHAHFIVLDLRQLNDRVAPPAVVASRCFSHIHPYPAW